MAMQIQACDFPAMWANSVSTGDIEKLINLYNENSVLMPTFSPHTVRTHEKLVDYFEKLSERKGLDVDLHENTVVCQKTGETSYVITGIYSFKFEIDQTLLTFPSRFTFVVDLSLDKPILHHHSSQVPRTLS